MPTNVLIIELILALICIISFWKIFSKANKPGWAAIIPIYNVIVWLEVVGKPWWWLILLIIPFVNIVFMIWLLNLTSKSFGQGVGFTIGLILLFPIFILILAFGNFKYNGPAGSA